MITILVMLIRVYQFVRSPFRKPACRFIPSCSEYAIHALQLHGLARGSWLVFKRLFRCHPYEKLGGRSGYDPIPPGELKPH